MEGLLDDAARARLPDPQPTALTIASLEVGVFGVLAVEVRHVHAVKTFQRKNGGEGCLRRVTVGDATGEVDVVLWGDQALRPEPFEPRAKLLLRGTTVKPGWQGGLELGIAGAVIEPAPSETIEIAGKLVGLGDTELVGDPPDVRFRATATVGDAGHTVVLWDAAVRVAVAAGLGASVRIDATPHPLLDDHYEADTLVAQP